MSKVIELPKKCRLIVVTDIHGNKDIFEVLKCLEELE